MVFKHAVFTRDSWCILPDEHSHTFTMALVSPCVIYTFIMLFRVSYTKRNRVQVRMAENMHLDLFI